MKIITILDYDHTKQKYEENKQPSLTVPDMTMTIREIIDRYANGGVIEQFIPHYDDEIEDADEFLPDPRFMDLADRQELAEQFREELAHKIQIREKSEEENKVLNLEFDEVERNDLAQDKGTK